MLVVACLQLTAASAGVHAAKSNENMKFDADHEVASVRCMNYVHAHITRKRALRISDDYISIDIDVAASVLARGARGQPKVN